MAWTGVWSIKVDGNELNTKPIGGNYIATCPELTWKFEMDPVMAPVEGDYPVLVRLQPREGRYNLNIQMAACEWATWETQRHQLALWLAAGTHAFTFQVRGMAASATFNAAVTSFIDSPMERRVTAVLLAPHPFYT